MNKITSFEEENQKVIPLDRIKEDDYPVAGGKAFNQYHLVFVLQVLYMVNI